MSAVELAYLLALAVLFFDFGFSDPESEASSWSDRAGNALLICPLVVLGAAVLRLGAVWLSDDPRVPRWTMFAVLMVNSVAIVVGVWAGLAELDSGEISWWIFFTSITTGTAGLAALLLTSTRAGSDRILVMD